MFAFLRYFDRTVRFCLAGFFVVACVAFAHGAELSRGNKWVRTHDFTIMSAVGPSANYSAASYDPGVYAEMDNSTFLPWTWSPYSFLQKNDSVDLPWHELVWVDYTVPGGLTDNVKTLSQYFYNQFDNNTGYTIMDEPNRLQMDTLRSAGDWYRQTFPDSIVYTNLTPYGQSDERYYGTTPPVSGYNYNQYLNDAINILGTDVLMYDNYPFLANGTTNNIYFTNMAMVRQKALDAGIPYWAWMQSYTDNSYYRTPSGSDLRMEVYSHLTYGYTGISYFTYNDLVGPAIINNDNSITQLYIEARNINAHVKNIGNVLRFLTSTDVRYVAGEHREVYYESWDIFHIDPHTRMVNNSLPADTVAWASGAGGDSHIVDIEIFLPGVENNALIGFFTDDDGQEYFMFTNLKHGAGLAPGDCSLEFIITFDETINEILMLDPDTGDEVLVTLVNHVLDWDLAGGTGALFKYNTGHFASEFLEGDANHDGVVSAGDYASVQANFGRTGERGLPGDANLDGVVSAGDYASIQANFGKTLSYSTAVPEPASILVIGLGCVSIIRRRKR